MKANGANTEIILERTGLMPMPIDLVVTYQDGTSEMIYLPLVMMRGEKPAEKGMPKRIHTEAWQWTDLSKTLILTRDFKTIKSVEIDPSGRMADIDRENNKVEF